MSADAERSALGALWWAGEAHRAIAAIRDGLDDAARAEVAALLKDPEFTAQSREQLEERMLGLAGKAVPR